MKRGSSLRLVSSGCPSAPAAFERYASLVRQIDANPALRTNLAHNVAIVRAWAAWRDAFLAADRPSS